VRAQLPGQPLWLAPVHREQAEGGDQLTQVIRGRRDDQQAATRAQDAAQFSAVPRREHAEYDLRRAVGHRQPLPHVAADGADPRMGPGRPAQRELRDVQGQPGPSGHRVEHAGQVVPGTRADVDHAAGLALRGQGLLGRRSQFGDQRAEMAGGEEVGPGCSHGGSVARTGLGPGGQHAYVALPRDVVAVPGRATQRAALPVQVLAADPAGQVPDHVLEHPCILPVRRPNFYLLSHTARSERNRTGQILRYGAR
jgi:hypothetical protein